MSTQTLGHGQNLPGVKYVINYDTRTTMAAQSLSMNAGEEFDFYRDPGHNDTSGWAVSATVVDVS